MAVLPAGLGFFVKRKGHQSVNTRGQMASTSTGAAAGDKPPFLTVWLGSEEVGSGTEAKGWLACSHTLACACRSEKSYEPTGSTFTLRKSLTRTQRTD